MSSPQNEEYINSSDYKKLASKIDDLWNISVKLSQKLSESRRLRYAEIDIDAEREAGNIAPDETYVSVHVIDTNIRREQSSYIQYITQSPRAVILRDVDFPSTDLSNLEVDLTNRLRYPNWQLPKYACIDSSQMNGYGVCEVVFDDDMPGDLKDESISYSDFSFVADTKNIQDCEVIGRNYFYTKTKLKEILSKTEDKTWNREQLQKLIDSEPNNDDFVVYYDSNYAETNSLYILTKVMFRKDGIVQVGMACSDVCDDWVQTPRPLFLGRKKVNKDILEKKDVISRYIQSAETGGIDMDTVKMLIPGLTDEHIQQIKGGLPPSDDVYETMYPFFIYPYLITENNTISSLKGRVFLDQDAQTAASDLLSSGVTKAVRSSGLYFSKNTSDPNSSFLMEKNSPFKTGALIDGNITEMELKPPDASVFNAVNMIISMNQQETSQVNFAETNRQGDSRKTAAAIKAATHQQQQLSSVQVTLLSTALKSQYEYMVDIIKSRVLAGVITVPQTLFPLYAKNFSVKPSGDVDVIERQQKQQLMMSAWPVVQTTGAAPLFLADILESMFPETASKYIEAIKQQKQQQQQQQNSQQAQRQQQFLQELKVLSDEIVSLSKHREFFSEIGEVNAFPVIQNLAEQIKRFTTANKNGQQGPIPSVRSSRK